MAEIKLLGDTTLQTVINDDATLADGARAAADYDNGTELDIWCIPYLEVQWNTTAPTSGDMVADLYILPGDNNGTPDYPEGGDAGLGTDDTPQAIFKVGAFESVNPSLTVNEILALRPILLYPQVNRFVLLNTSGQEFDLTWELRGMMYKVQSS
jgi:hypothetical protein